ASTRTSRRPRAARRTRTADRRPHGASVIRTIAPDRRARLASAPPLRRRCEMTAPEKPKRGWLDRLRAKREERKRREAEPAYRNVGATARSGSRPPDGVGGGTGGPTSGPPGF